MYFIQSDFKIKANMSGGSASGGGPVAGVVSALDPVSRTQRKRDIGLKSGSRADPGDWRDWWTFIRI